MKKNSNINNKKTVITQKYICTYFDINYLSRGLALYESLKINAENFTLFVLCLDDKTYKTLKELGANEIKLIKLSAYIDYWKIELNRFEDNKQFYFSITPNFCLYVFKNYPDVNLLLYLDADIFFFNDINILYSEIENSSIAICSHRRNFMLKLFSNHYGNYNVGINFFRRDKEGLNCLSNWKLNCDNWRPNNKVNPLPFFSDQIYLDQWPTKYSDLKIIDHIGINTAPWNAINYQFYKNNNQYFVNNKLLVAYHFSALNKIDSNTWHGNTNYNLININNTLLDIYKDYIRVLRRFDINKVEIIKLKFKGNFIKKFIYKITKPFFNDEIKLNKDG